MSDRLDLSPLVLPLLSQDLADLGFQPVSREPLDNPYRTANASLLN